MPQKGKRQDLGRRVSPDGPWRRITDLELGHVEDGVRTPDRVTLECGHTILNNKGRSWGLRTGCPECKKEGKTS